MSGIVESPIGPDDTNDMQEVVNYSSESSDIAVLTKDTEQVVDQYISVCKKYNVEIDPSIVISLLTKWDKLQPTKRFSEGGMIRGFASLISAGDTFIHITLLDILQNSKHIRRLDFGGLAMRDPTYRGAGNGNSNARILKFILEKNNVVKSLDLSNTGLDDDGLGEICKGISRNSSITDLNISYNHFGEVGANYLRKVLENNKTIKNLDLSWNALGYNAISNVLCVCDPKQIVVRTAGNFVFEEVLNSVSHGVAFLASIVGTIVLLRDVADDQKFTDYHFWACFVYSFSLMFLFLSSCLYHSFFMLPTPSRILLILDHTGIYFLIAGSYTPFLLITMHHDAASRVLLSAQWITCFFGMMFAALADYNKKITSIIELSAFLFMGFSVVFVWDNVMASLCYESRILLILGGAAYVFGVVFFKLGDIRPIYHTVWHLFVVLGAALHWFDIYLFIVRTDLGIQASANINDAAVLARDNILETVESFRDML